MRRHAAEERAALWEIRKKASREEEEEEEENHGCNYVLIGTEHFAVAAETNA